MWNIKSFPSTNKNSSKIGEGQNTLISAFHDNLSVCEKLCSG